MPTLEYLTEIEKNVLQELKSKVIKQFNGRVALIRLFGSKARGDMHQESDIDLLVVLKEKKREDDNWIVDLELELMDKYNYQFYLSTITYDKSEFDRLNNIPTVFMQIVKKEGIDLWQSTT